MTCQQQRKERNKTNRHSIFFLLVNNKSSIHMNLHSVKTELLASLQLNRFENIRKNSQKIQLIEDGGIYSVEVIKIFV